MEAEVAGSKKVPALENFLFYNTMACLVKGLEGDYTIVDLRNESCVTGKIIEVDAFMNIEMEDCYYYNSRGDVYPFQSFFVKGRNIRYVHIPPQLKVSKVIENQLASMGRPKQLKRAPTLKEKRAKKYQKELLLDVAKK